MTVSLSKKAYFCLVLSLTFFGLGSAETARSKILKEPDELRADMRFDLTPEMEISFAGVGRIECQDEWGKYVSTAFIADDGKYIIGSGHFNLVYSTGQGSGRIAKRFQIPECSFVIRDADATRIRFSHSLSESSTIRFLDEAQLRRTPQLDIAVHSLPTPPRFGDGSLVPALPTTVVRVDDLPLSEPVALIAYATIESSSRRSIAYKCRPSRSRDHDQIFRHLCDTIPSNSGGPLILLLEGEPTAFAINTAGGTGIFNLATSLGSAPVQDVLTGPKVQD